MSPSEEDHTMAGVPKAQRTMPAYLARVSILFGMLTAAFLRLYDLGLRPIHHDEAVNWFLFRKVIRQFGYTYNPTNYHGPLHFQIGALNQLALGDSTAAQRVPVALAGIAAVWFMGRLARRPTQHTTYVGFERTAVVWLAAVSPSLIYFARDFIHETWLVLFTATFLVAAHRARWAADLTQKRVAAALVGASLGGMIAIKETFVITVAAWGVGGILAAMAAPAAARASLTAVRPLLKEFIGATVAVVVLSYTNLLQDPSALMGLIETWFAWGPRGIEGAGHDKVATYFLELLWRHEAPLLVFSAIGLAYALFRREPVDVFRAGWALSLLGVYSAIPYKTPWLIIQIVIPFVLLAGTGVHALAEGLPTSPSLLWRARVRRVTPYAAALALTLGCGFMLRATKHVVFDAYDDPKTGLCYVQTHREMRELMQELVHLREQAGERLHVDSSHAANYPFNWYLRTLDVKHHGREPLPDAVEGPIVLYSPRDEVQIWELLEGDYVQRDGRFRGAMRVGAFIEADLADSLPDPAAWSPVTTFPDTFEPPPIPEERTPGLAGRWFEDRIPRGIPFQEKPLKRVTLNWDNDRSKPRKAPLFAVWEGWLEVAEEGEHHFGLQSDDGAKLWLDGELMIDHWNTENQPPTRKATTSLSAGLHHVRLTWFDRGGPGSLRLTWKRPGGPREPLAAPWISH
jgi:uncharacterized protein (TIGR03663 family)